MTSLEQSIPTTSIAPATRIGIVALTVADLDRSLAYYTDAMGLAVLQRGEGEAVLGAGDRPLLLLREQRGARPWPTDGVTGLYHFAILVPTRTDLGRWLGHYLELGLPFPGQGDHLVSEALYLRDPDGHGIEIYRDRPRSEWPMVNGRVQMASDPVDLRGMLAEAEQEGKPWSGLPAGTTIGHMHLQVGDLARADAFYHGLLGFDVMAQLPQALFVAAGGYHHHLGLNTWHSRGAGPASRDTANLRFFTLALPSDEARADLVKRLEAAGHAVERAGDAIAVRDPWQNLILLHTGELPDAAAAESLAAAAA